MWQRGKPLDHLLCSGCASSWQADELQSALLLWLGHAVAMIGDLCRRNSQTRLLTAKTVNVHFSLGFKTLVWILLTTVYANVFRWKAQRIVAHLFLTFDVNHHNNFNLKAVKNVLIGVSYNLLVYIMRGGSVACSYYNKSKTTCFIWTYRHLKNVILQLL